METRIRWEAHEACYIPFQIFRSVFVDQIIDMRVEQQQPQIKQLSEPDYFFEIQKQLTCGSCTGSIHKFILQWSQ